MIRSSAALSSPKRKFTVPQLLAWLRMAAAFRKKMLLAGGNDNTGAIHSATRLVELLALRLRYPGVTHINNLRRSPDAEFSVAAWCAYQSGLPVQMEHVLPVRAFTKLVMERIDRGASDRALATFIKRSYRVVLLTPGERRTLDRVNRTTIDPLRMAGIALHPRNQRPAPKR